MATLGATVYVSGRRREALDALAQDIAVAGGEVHVDVVDALDDLAVQEYVNAAAKKSGHIDVVFNGIGGRPAELGYPARATETSLSDFMTPLQRIVTSQFITARAAAKHMMAQKSGSIVTLSATLSGGAFAYMTGISAACGAIEVMTKSMAGEFGPANVRVNCVRASAMPETRTIQETGAGQARLRGAPPQFPAPPLGRPTTVKDTAGAAAFLASDAANGMTGQTITVCGGQFVD
jgi:NAD(P)-dependent dehydrogenase (short-subunit alcohol dehydrogenase family)